MPLFSKIAVVGFGLIGGSAGKAALARGAAAEVAAVARRPETIEEALSSGAATFATRNLAEGVGGADFILVATPPGTVAGIIKECIRWVSPGAVITDAASVKEDIVREAESITGGDVCFVGSHPVAGSEKSGVEHADANLFDGADCVITPASDRGKEKVRRFWEVLGMRVFEMSPADHDRMMAASSHLPHAASCALVRTAARLSGRGEEGAFISGGGFRDTTRVAAAPAKLWSDIIMTNRGNVLDALKEYAGVLKRLEEILEGGDEPGLLEFLEDAAEEREMLVSTGQSRPASCSKKKTVAIDGPAGSGKSTVARLAAERLGFLYLDTGAMYRAATWRALRMGVDFRDGEDLARSVARMDIRFSGRRVLVDGEEATEAIRTPEVTGRVYLLADIQGVRDAMVRQQRKLGENGGIVAEGRDTATIVFPGADVKIYLDASVSERARRRHAELAAKGAAAGLEEVKKEIIERDARDMKRKIAPLKAAEGAAVIDTTGMTIDQVVSAVVRNVSED